MSFARNFALGQQIAQTALDAYDNYRERRLLQDIANARPVEIQNAYTSQDVEQLHAIANARDAQGNPYYTLQANPDGSYGLKTNFSYVNQDGQTVQPGSVVATFTPRAKVVEFLGNRYAPEELTENRIAGLRARAMANVISKRDPVRGLQMLRNIASMEQDEERHQWEREQYPLVMRRFQAEVGAKEHALEQAKAAAAREKAIRDAYSWAFRLPPEELEKLTWSINFAPLPFITTKQDKDGFIVMELDSSGKPTGREFKLTNFQIRQLAAAHNLAELGYGDESIKILASVNKDIADIISESNKTALEMARVANQTMRDRHRIRLEEKELGLRARDMAARQAARNAEMRAAMDRQTMLNKLSKQAAELLRRHRDALNAGNIALANKYLAELQGVDTEISILLNKPPRNILPKSDPNLKDHIDAVKAYSHIYGPDVARMMADMALGRGPNLDRVLRNLNRLNDSNTQ